MMIHLLGTFPLRPLWCLGHGRAQLPPERAHRVGCRVPTSEAGGYGGWWGWPKTRRSQVYLVLLKVMFTLPMGESPSEGCLSSSFLFRTSKSRFRSLHSRAEMGDSAAKNSRLVRDGGCSMRHFTFCWWMSYGTHLIRILQQSHLQKSPHFLDPLGTLPEVSRSCIHSLRLNPSAK